MADSESSTCSFVQDSGCHTKLDMPGTAIHSTYVSKFDSVVGLDVGRSAGERT